MRLVDNYNYLPGCCWICRGVAKPIIDMEMDLDGHNSPDDPNPSSNTRLYVCADCAVELGRLMAPHRGLELNKIGELGLFKRVSDELAEQVDLLETKLESIASAINGRGTTPDDTPEEPVHFPEPSDGEETAPDPDFSETSVPPARKRSPLRRKDRSSDINVDFLGDL